MVYTVTLNPAIDYVIKTDGLSAGVINRSKHGKIFYGGKGINVSVILSRLGVENKALGFLAGFTGRELERLLTADGVSSEFIYLESGLTRINVKIKSNGEYDINADGPEISEADIEKLLDKLGEIKDGDYLVIAGSVPKSLPADVYERILSRLEGRNISFVIDAEDGLLKSALKYRPFLIKPNHLELGALFGVKTETDAEIIKYAKELQSLGAKNVLVSRAENGAILLDENSGVTGIKTVKGTLVNSVGCGDSMLAGFIAGYIKTKSYSEALRLAAACGNATAFSGQLADKNEIERIYGVLNTDV
ncbi:MAG: 1-phosphofructokinase [Eubacterium sp.]|nr:1-phosphofructokinase [Eubacterium sp.]